MYSFILLFSLFMSAATLQTHPLLLLSPEIESVVVSEIDQELKQIQAQTAKALLPEAQEVIQDTKKAGEALLQQRIQEALSTIERAISKIDVLLARHSDKTLLPIESRVELMDFAPSEGKMIKDLVSRAEKAIKSKHYSESRALLNLLRKEIMISTSSLLPSSYSTALKKAALLTSQQAVAEAYQALRETLNTLIITNQAIPLSLIRAKVLIHLALENPVKNKDLALNLLHHAWHELEQARELGYISKIEEYAIFQTAMKEIEKHIETDTSASSAFQSLKEKALLFLKQQIEEIKRTFHLD